MPQVVFSAEDVAPPQVELRLIELLSMEKIPAKWNYDEKSCCREEDCR